MTRSAANAAGLADRFFELSLLGLISSGYLAILGSGYLDTPAAVLTAAGLALRALLVLGWLRKELTPRAVAAATVTYLAFFPLDWLFISRELLRATVHLVCFLVVVKILTAKTNRDYVYVMIIAFLELVAAAILSANLSFFAFLALFLLFGVATFTSSEIRHSTRRRMLIARGGLHRFHVRLALLSLSVAIGILSLTAGLFFLLPRTAHAAFQRLASDRYHLPGFSNEVKLGEIGEVLQQSTPVMHVRVIEANGPLHLKWRGGILATFDGKRWFNRRGSYSVLRVPNGRLILADDAQRRRVGDRISYEVRLKAVASDALFFAGVPEVLWIDAPFVARSATGAYRVSYGARQETRYFASSFLERSGASDLYVLPDQPPNRNGYLQLPALDPRIGALARNVTAGQTSEIARARAIKNYLQTNYSYTLELPSQEVADPLVHFLFERRKGHCEYYASAMAIMLRTLDIPSRIVTGFQGGVFNPLSGWYVVRASDAHSWVEAWLPSRGWTTFDPTPPDPNARRTSIWTRLYLYVDAAEMFWQNWVVNYDRERQLVLATGMGNSGRGFGARWVDRLRLAGMEWKERVAGWLRDYGAALVALLVLFFIAWRYGPPARRWWRARERVKKVLQGDAKPSDATLLYNRMLDLLRRRGLEKPIWLTPGEFAGVIPPSETAALVRNLTLAYHELRYGGNRSAAGTMTAMLERLEQL